jgi:hypothetical protein
MSKEVTKKALIVFLTIILTSCSSAVVTTPTPTLIINTVIITQTPTITLTPTETPYQLSGKFCDLDDVNWAIKNLKNINGDSDNATPTPTPVEDTLSATQTAEAFHLTEAQRLIIIAAIKEKQLELSMLNVPECLLPAKEHLANSLAGMFKLFNPDKDVTDSEILSNLFYAGAEQQAFEDEIKKIQECLPYGCPTPTFTEQP